MMIRTLKNENELPDVKVWALSELTAFTLLHHEWPAFGYLEKTGYDAVDEMIPDARRLYRKNKGMRVFLEDIMRPQSGSPA